MQNQFEAIHEYRVVPSHHWQVGDFQMSFVPALLGVALIGAMAKKR